MPCSTGRFRDSVLGDMCNVLSPGFFVSLIPLRSCGFNTDGVADLVTRGADRFSFEAAIGAVTKPTREKAVAPGARDEGSMYHM